MPCRGFLKKKLNLYIIYSYLVFLLTPWCPGIYSILLTSAAGALGEDTVEAAGWVRALRGGLDAVMLYGGARPGDRTMVTLHTARDTRDTRVHHDTRVVARYT